MFLKSKGPYSLKSYEIFGCKGHMYQGTKLINFGGRAQNIWLKLLSMSKPWRIRREYPGIPSKRGRLFGCKSKVITPKLADEYAQNLCVMIHNDPSYGKNISTKSQNFKKKKMILISIMV